MLQNKKEMKKIKNITSWSKVKTFLMWKTSFDIVDNW
jgi:hypothetical protein